MIIPPFAGVRLVEYRDRVELTPVCWFREFVGYGKCKADQVGPSQENNLHWLYKTVMGDREIWVIAVWRRYEDGQEEAIRIQYLDPEATEADAKKELGSAIEFQNLTKEQLEDLTQCFRATEEDINYIEERFPNVIDAKAVVGSIEQYDLYQARLKGCASEAGWNMGESPIRRVGLFTTEHSLDSVAARRGWKLGEMNGRAITKVNHIK